MLKFYSLVCLDPRFPFHLGVYLGNLYPYPLTFVLAYYIIPYLIIFSIKMFVSTHPLDAFIMPQG